MIIAIDTETYEYNTQSQTYKPILNAQRFVIGCLMTDCGKCEFYKDRKVMFERIIELIDKNKKNKRKTYIYAHKMEYDWYAIAKDYFLDKRINYILFRPFLAIWNNDAYFLDTMTFYKTSLNNIGEMLGFNKLEMPKEIKEIDELKEYVKRDTEIVLKCITSLKQRLKVLGFKPRKLLTAGQLSMTCFLTYCRKNWTEKHFTEYNEDLKRREVVKSENAKLVREAYRGGDNQALQLGKYKDVTLIDINGMYADNMRKMTFPDLKSEILVKKPNIHLFTRYLNEEIGVARIKVKAPNIISGVLPVRYAEFQLFPTNTKLRGTWTFIEIQQALKEGYKIIDVEWCIRWKELRVNGNKFNPLKRFVEELYPLEQNSKNKMEKIPIKLLRNNLSGKFAQYKKNKITKVVERIEVMKYIAMGYKTKSKYENKYIIVKETDDYIPSYVNPIISVYITAMGRLRLREEEKKIPYEDRLYKDTDSLMFIDRGNKTINKFETNKELGSWKVEKQNAVCKILGEKRYSINDDVKISGMHSRLRTKDVIEKEENVKIERMYGISSAIETGNWNNVGVFNEIEIEMKQHSKSQIPIPTFIDECKVELEE